MIAVVVRDVLKALVYLHAQGLAHRDIKGQNCLVPAPPSLSLSHTLPPSLPPSLSLSHTHTQTGGCQRARQAR